MIQNLQGPLLARGNTAEICAWGNDHILKLYLTGFSEEEVECEAVQARLARATGIATPAVLESVSIGTRRGVIFERVYGSTMFEAMLTDSHRSLNFAHILADLQVALHTQRTVNFPSQRVRLQKRLQAMGDQRFVEILATLPDGDRLCHGDFHPNNVLLTAQGPTIIDWVDATQGHPLADVARTLVLLRYAQLPESVDVKIHHAFNALRVEFETGYLARYRLLLPFDEAELRLWIAVMAAARLSESISAAERQTLYTLAISSLQDR